MIGTFILVQHVNAWFHHFIVDFDMWMFQVKLSEHP